MKKIIVLSMLLSMTFGVQAQSNTLKNESVSDLSTISVAQATEGGEQALQALSDDERRTLILQAADKQDWKTAFDLLLPLAQKGDYQAQANLGILYARGQGVEQDFEKAYWWFSEAAERGSIKAINNLAVFYLQGNSVKKDIKHSIKLFEKTAESGSLDAMMVLGQIYENELKELPMAFKWFKKAAEAGNHDAQYRLAMMYEKGEGTKKNKKQAVYWYQQLSRQSSELAAVAQERLSRLK